MPPVTCTRCFAVFEATNARPGLAPFCPACAARAPSAELPLGPASGTASRRIRRRKGRRALVATAAIVLLAGAAAAAVVLRGRTPPVAPEPTAVELQVAAWREAELVSAVQRPDGAAADASAARGWEALAADEPARAADALRAFRTAIAL